MPPSKWKLEKAAFGGNINLDEGLTTIGRNHHSTIVASSDYVSRNHAHIHISPESRQIRITDLGSKNGIYVNEYKYCNAECELNVGDRIGIGVEVDDDVVLSFPEGKYPIYILRRQSEEQTPSSQTQEEVQSDAVIPQPNAEPPDKPNDKDEPNKDLAELNEDPVPVMPKLYPQIELPPPVEIKTEIDFEAASTSRKICENIKNIFGDLNSEILETLPEETRKIAESSNQFKEPVVCGDVICLLSSDDEDSETGDKRQSTVISPQLFNDSFKSDNDKPTNEPQQADANLQDKEICKPPETNDASTDNPPERPAKDTPLTENNQKQAIDEQPTPNDIKDEFNDNEEDMWFTQQIFEDMKEDLMEDEPKPDIKIECDDPNAMPEIKQEIYPQNLDGTIISLDDDDEYDEDFETTTQKWTARLSKHVFSNSFNASQVYEGPYSDEEDEVAPASKTIFIVDDDDDDELDFVDRVAMKTIKTEPGTADEVVNRVEEPCPPPSPSPEKIKPPKSSFRRLQKELFSSSSSDGEDQSDKPSTSVASLQKFHEKIVRRLSTCEEVPTKKPRLSNKSDDEEGDQNADKIRSRRASSSHKTYSRRGSGSKRAHEDITSASAEDLFENLKQDEKAKEKRSEDHADKPKQRDRKRKGSTSSSGSHKRSHERKKSTDKRSHSRHGSSSTADQNGSSTIYKSATIARRKSIDSRLFNDRDDDECFVEVKKQTIADESRPQVPATPKSIRGPPEIIQPPKLPVNKGKLRGISAVQNRIADALKASADKKDLKRKWLEKPSEKKDKEIAKAIQETRRQKLKELNDKKQAESVAASKTPSNETSAENADKEANRTKLKVKITQNNRGAFLTELPTAKPRYTIPKKTQKPKESPAKRSTPPKADAPPKKPPEQRKPSTEVVTNFALELAQADTVLQRQTSRDRAKSTEQKQCAPPRPNKKAVSFASMNQHYEETKRALNKAKKVTFKLPPEIRYIESTLSAKPKRFQRESSTFMERKTNIRERYPILDKTDTLLDDIMSWSQIWLQNKQHIVNMMTFPMHSHFKTFNEYKNIVLPLLKMEYLGFLEQSMEQNTSRSCIHAEIDYSAPHKHRDYIFAKCNVPVRPSELSFNDLALIDIPLGSTMRQCFGYVSNVRQGNAGSCITIEVVANTISKEILKTKPKIKIRRVIDGIRMHLGTFNAIHQLEHTPLIDKILNPIELLNTADNNIRLSHIEYRGCNELNTEQREILLKTYEKAIDQLNPNISLINGPPGTGKSVLISNLAVQLLYGNEVNELDKKILICAQSNMAVDVIAEKLIKIKQKLSPETSPFNVVRYGVEEKVHPDVRGITIKGRLHRHRMDILHKQGTIQDQAGGEESLAREILELESRILELERHSFQDVRKEELTQMRKNLQLKKNIANQIFRPEDERRLTKWFLENANIVCCTLSGCIKLANFVDYFDICIIDEATQCTEPWTLMPLKFGVSNLIMVGDTQQLPATVISQSAKELGLEISLFTRIKTCLENKYVDTPLPTDVKDRPIYTLSEQYRMHSEISKWPNMYFYKNQLRNNPKTDEFKSSIKPFSILNLEYRQNDTYFGQASGQISNNLEAEFVAKLVTTLDNYIPNKFYSYGVITPYAHHREKLENMIRKSGLQNIMVNTIDSYQGIEKDVIIISNARTHGVGFLGNYQRLNVALTRPRKCLILCGNFKNLESVPSWASLLANAKERGLYHNISANDALDITKNVIEKIKIKR